MVKEVVWNIRALQDRTSIYQYWLFHNQLDSYSKKLEFLFQSSAKFIAAFPEIGTKTEIPGVRVKITRNFKFFYRFDSEAIEILRVWDSHQNHDTLKLF